MSAKKGKVTSCPRCGGEHKHVSFGDLVVPNPKGWTHIGSCPKTNRKIYMKFPPGKVG